MITRYSRPEMRAIWTDENKLKIWLQIELLASEALVKEGVVPAKDFAKIKAGCDKWFADLPGLVARQRELEKTLNHDVIGFTTAVAEAINDILQPQGVGVMIESEHSCMTMRGVNTPGSNLVTSRLMGVVRDDPRTREEFLRLARGD